jgi:hypothetical protein
VLEKQHGGVSRAYSYITGYGMDIHTGVSFADPLDRYIIKQ